MDDVTPEAGSEVQPETGSADTGMADSTMEVSAADDGSGHEDAEAGTAIPESAADADAPADPDLGPDSSPDPDPADADDDADEDEVAEEPSLAEKQSGYEPLAPTQLDSIQNKMVAGANEGQSERAKSIARNRKTRAEQHKALARTNRPDNA